MRVPAPQHKFAESLASAVTLASAFLLNFFLLVSTLNAATGSRNMVSRLERVWGLWAKQTPGIGAFWGLGVCDSRPRIGIVICPVFPFWRAGRPV